MLEWSSFLGENCFIQYGEQGDLSLRVEFDLKVTLGLLQVTSSELVCKELRLTMA